MRLSGSRHTLAPSSHVAAPSLQARLGSLRECLVVVRPKVVARIGPPIGQTLLLPGGLTSGHVAADRYPFLSVRRLRVPTVSRPRQSLAASRLLRLAVRLP